MAILSSNDFYSSPFFDGMSRTKKNVHEAWFNEEFIKGSSEMLCMFPLFKQSGLKRFALQTTN